MPGPADDDESPARKFARLSHPDRPPQMTRHTRAELMHRATWTLNEAIDYAVGFEPGWRDSMAYQKSEDSAVRAAFQWDEMLVQAGIAENGFVQQRLFIEWASSLPLPVNLRPLEEENVQRTSQFGDEMDLRRRAIPNGALNRNLKRALLALIFARYGGARSWTKAVEHAAADIQRVMHSEADGVVDAPAMLKWLREAKESLDEELRGKLTAKEHALWKFPEIPEKFPDFPPTGD